MADDNCACGPSAPIRPRTRMGVSSLGPRPQIQFDRSLPLSSNIAPRPASPPRMPRTVPGRSRSPRRCETRCDTTLTPDSADTTLTDKAIRSPDMSKYESTMEELSKLEFVEMQNVEDDLRDFHIKRRKLVFNIASLNMSKAKKSIKKAVSKMGL